jgi:hypothetical protein
MNRLAKFVTQQDRTLMFEDQSKGVAYYISAFWNDQRETEYNFTTRSLDSARLLQNNLVMTTPERVLKTMKEVCPDTRKWRVL